MDWYGADYAPAEIQALRSEPRSASALVEGVLSDLGLGESIVLARAKEAWPGIVGADAAKRTTPVSLRHRVLTVEVASSSWRYALQREHHTRIVTALREITDGGVCSVRFVPPGRYA